MPGDLEGLAKKPKGDAIMAEIIARTLRGRLADPGEISSVALFLAWDESAAMTGGEVFADGGLAQV
jgi:NAD(P)-dependent dehydrogenase (short-subunit alcohol dehydrogenase family)